MRLSLLVFFPRYWKNSEQLRCSISLIHCTSISMNIIVSFSGVISRRFCLLPDSNIFFTRFLGTNLVITSIPYSINSLIFNTRIPSRSFLKVLDMFDISLSLEPGGCLSKSSWDAASIDSSILRRGIVICNVVTSTVIKTVAPVITRLVIINPVSIPSPDVVAMIITDNSKQGLKSELVATKAVIIIPKIPDFQT